MIERERAPATLASKREAKKQRTLLIAYPPLEEHRPPTHSTLVLHELTTTTRQKNSLCATPCFFLSSRLPGHPTGRGPSIGC